MTEQGTPPPQPPPLPPPRRLYRSRRNRVIAGVCGGLGEYLGIDPVIVRIIAVVVALAGGAAVLAYIIAMIVIPEGDGDGSAPQGDRDVSRYLIGAALLFAGGIWLLTSIFPGLFAFFDFRALGPILLIALGVLLLVGRRR